MNITNTFPSAKAVADHIAENNGSFYVYLTDDHGKTMRTTTRPHLFFDHDDDPALLIYAPNDVVSIPGPAAVRTVTVEVSADWRPEDHNAKEVSQ